MRSRNLTSRVGRTAPVFLSGVSEYLVSELLEMAGNLAQKRSRRRVVPKDVASVLANDKELGRAFGSAGIFVGDELKSRAISAMIKPPPTK